MTAKFDKFKAAFIALCEEHDVMLTYDFSEEVYVKNRRDVELTDHTFNPIIKVEDILWDGTNQN